MISVIVPVRADLRATQNCLLSLGRAFINRNDVEYIVIDDCCKDELGHVLYIFERLVGEKAVVDYHFNTNVGYVEAVNKGLLLSQGDYIFVISNDMIVTSSYVKTLLDVIEKDKSIGIVRGISNYVEGYNGRYIVSPFLGGRQITIKGDRLINYGIEDFGKIIRDFYGEQLEDIEYHTGDGFLIKKEIIDNIGIYDNRFKQYFGDVDYGIRIQQAGHRVVCALGAWLLHEGAISHRNTTREQRLADVQKDYERFRAKWDMSLPEQYPNIDNINFEKYVSTRLNLGSGEQRLKDYWNIDHKLGSEAYPLDVPDNTVDEIRASHILEHFPYKDTDKILKHWVSKLKSGGVLRIAVPNFRYIAQKYLDGEQINALGYVMGGQIDEDDYHKAIFDNEALTKLLKDAGLKDIICWSDGIQDDSSLPVSLNLQGTKER